MTLVINIPLVDGYLQWDVMFRSVVISGCARSDTQDSQLAFASLVDALNPGQTLIFDTMWYPPVISWFIPPSTSSIYPP